MTTLPPMVSAQTAAWHGVMDLHERLQNAWTLVGGQMVHLHCAERDFAPPRPTNDVDTVIDVRASSDALRVFTQTLVDLGFVAKGISAEGAQHRWVRGEAVIDVLLPDGVGDTAAGRKGVGGSPTIPTPGGTQALNRTESVPVTVEGRDGFVRRPTLVGALVMKAAAHTAPGGGARRRHRYDFATLAGLVSAQDFRGVELSNKDRRRLRAMVTATLGDQDVLLAMGGAEESLDRLARAAGLGGTTTAHRQ